MQKTQKTSRNYSKRTLNQIKTLCEKIEFQMFLEDVKQAQKEALADEPMYLKRS